MNDLKKKWWVVDGDDACKDEVSQLNKTYLSNLGVT